MEALKLGAVESKFADVIWEHEPIPSGPARQALRAAAGVEKVHHVYDVKTIM